MDTSVLMAITDMLKNGGPAVLLVLVWFGYKAVTAANKAVQAIENMDSTTTASAAAITTIAQNVASTKETCEAIADKVDA